MWPGGLLGLGLLLLIIGVIVKAASVLVTVGIVLIVLAVIWFLFTGIRGGGRSGPYV